MAPDGTVLDKFQIENNLPGAKALESYTLNLSKSRNFNSLCFGAEASSLYSFHLANFITDSQTMKQYSPNFYLLNPKLIKNFKKAYPDISKTDDIDAFIITDRLRFGRLPMPYKADMLYLALQRLTRFRFHLIQALVKEKTYFLSILFLKLSSFSKIKPFSNTFSTSSISIITEFSPDQIAFMDMDVLTNLIRKLGKNRFANPYEVSKALKQVVRESYRLRPNMNNSITMVLAASIQTIKTLSINIKELDKAIEKELEAIPNAPTILKSIPGLGPVYSAGILAEIGNSKRFKSNAKLAKFSGLTWRKHQTADFDAQITRLMKSGNKYLRYYLVEAAGSVMVHIDSYRAFYQRKYNEVNKFQHKRALVMTARKLIRLIFALLRDNKLYQPSLS